MLRDQAEDSNSIMERAHLDNFHQHMAQQIEANRAAARSDAEAYALKQEASHDATLGKLRQLRDLKKNELERDVQTHSQLMEKQVPSPAQYI